VDPAIIARDRLPAEVRLHRLERLQDVCRMVAGNLELGLVLSEIGDAVRDSFGFARVAMYGIDRCRRQIVGPLADTISLEALSARLSVETELRRGACPAIDVALGLTPYHLASAGPARREAAPCHAVCAGLPPGTPTVVMPLEARGERMGLMVATRSSPGTLSPAEVEELRPFAEQAALALAQSRGSVETRRRVGFLSALLEISISLTSHSELPDLLQGACNKLLDVSNLEIAAVYLMQEGQVLQLQTSAGVRPELPEFYRPFRLGERLAGRAALERLVIVNRDVQQDDSPAAAIDRQIGLQTVICAPLVLRGELLGVLAAGAVRDLELTGEEMDLISSVAHQLSAAIANLRLLEETRGQMEEHRRHRDELALLYGISRAVVATIDLEQRLRVIAEGLTEATRTTRCAIFRRDRDDLLPWHSFGDTAEEKRCFRALDISAADAARLLRAVSARKPPVVMRSNDQAPFSLIPWLRGWDMRSALWLPLAFQNRMTGVAVVYQPGEERPFSPHQIELAAAVANQAAIAIRVSQAYEHERNVAETLQRSFMPHVGARLKNFDLGQTYHAALQEAQVGGDFYDVFPLPGERVALLMADVAGKGLHAATQTGMIKHMLRAYAAEESSPAAVLERVNRGICAYLDPDRFITAFYAVLCPETGELQYGNAGHESPILALKEHGYCTSLDITGPALGLDPAITYFSRSLSLTPGDLLLLYTDGIVNAARRVPGSKGWTDERFGRERLEALTEDLATGKPGRIVSQIYRAARAFAAGNLQDDCALLALKAKDVWK
jgi:serine phosphatase RsbU (regulator of sigma subunit)